MRRKLVAALISTAALAAVLAGPATASAATLTLNSSVLGIPATEADFESSSTTIQSDFGSYDCEQFTFGTNITQNGADPVTLQLSTARIAPSVNGCETSSGAFVNYSNIQLTSPMEFNADGTGSLSLRLSESWNGVINCVREGVLDLSYIPNQSGSDVNFDGTLSRVSGSAWCMNDVYWQGWFATPTDDFGAPIDWIVTP
jgi:hypothetical protein